MNYLYCNLGGSQNDTLHLDTITVVGLPNHPAGSVEDVRAIIAQLGARYVSFKRGDMPQRPVPVDDPRLDQWIARMLGNRPRPQRQPRRATTLPADFDPTEFIDM